jgi:predicted acetyltransferase
LTVSLTLVSPSTKWAREVIATASEFRQAGERDLMGSPEQMRADFAGFVAELELTASQPGVRPGWVTANTYWLVRDGRTVLGRSNLRHCLTPELEDVGGHIGYAIRPSERRKGYGTQILALTLEKARERGLSRVMVTCDTANTASARIIEKNGGVLASQSVSPGSRKLVSRYWIEL